jgi:1-aminocyclopropane-1-carboxylate deaminase
MDNNILLYSQVNSPLQQLNALLFERQQLTVYIKRDDMIHPQISGNKWRKLKYNLVEAQQQKKDLLISFGGAYSNHIHALAYAGKIHNIDTLGIIRGEYDPMNPTLQQSKMVGMKLKFISRIEYKKRHDPAFIEDIQQQFPNALIIPEGGTNVSALLGMKELIEEIPQHKADYIMCPCGSGGTTAGLLMNASKHQKIISIPVLKQANYLKEEILQLAQTTDENLEFLTQYHQGGYGKITPELLSFIKEFYQQYQIQLEPIYNGKMMMAFYDLVQQGHFKQGSSITLIHTGGLQGLNGLKQRGIVPENIFDDI